jgi:Rrf2 family protein
MKISDGVEWALHCASILAALPAGATLPGKALAEFHGVSESYLLKHLKALVAAGVFESVPGPKGGYRLARPAAAISFLDVAQAIDGRGPAFRCTEIRCRAPLDDPPACFRKPCAINVTMLEAEAAWRDVLRRRTIADMVAALGETLPASRRRAAERWFAPHVRVPLV